MEGAVPSLEAVGRGTWLPSAHRGWRRQGLRLEQERAGTEGMEVISKRSRGPAERKSGLRVGLDHSWGLQADLGTRL